MPRAVLFDLDGVVYEGEKPIDGAVAAIQWFRQHAIPHLFVTNTTSRPREALVEKLAAMGLPVGIDEIFTPALAAHRKLVDEMEGKPVALFIPAATIRELSGLTIATEDTPHVGAVVLGDLGDAWNFESLNRAFRLLMANQDTQLIALGMTRYWQAEDGLRLDTGPFVTALEFATGRKPQVMGKPAADFFRGALGVLGTSPSDTVMVGDDIRGDIGGASSAGMKTIQVRTGKYRPGDLDADIQPDAVVDSVADLPAWWSAQPTE